MFAVAESLVGDVFWHHFWALVERLPRYLQYLYQQVYDSAKATYEDNNSKVKNVFDFGEECAVNKVPVISRAEYNTILLCAEKIGNGQHDFIHILRRELHDSLTLPTPSLLSSIWCETKILNF